MLLRLYRLDTSDPQSAPAIQASHEFHTLNFLVEEVTLPEGTENFVYYRLETGGFSDDLVSPRPVRHTISLANLHPGTLVNSGHRYWTCLLSDEEMQTLTATQGRVLVETRRRSADSQVRYLAGFGQAGSPVVHFRESPTTADGANNEARIEEISSLNGNRPYINPLASLRTQGGRTPTGSNYFDASMIEAAIADRTNAVPPTPETHTTNVDELNTRQRREEEAWPLPHIDFSSIARRYQTLATTGNARLQPSNSFTFSSNPSSTITDSGVKQSITETGLAERLGITNQLYVEGNTLVSRVRLVLIDGNGEEEKVLAESEDWVELDDLRTE